MTEPSGFLDRCGGRIFGTLSLLLSIMLGGSTPLIAAHASISDIPLESVDGKSQRLSELAPTRVTVLVFIGVECPLVHQYVPVLSRLRERWPAQEVAIVAIDSNVQDSPQDVAEFIDSTKLTIPVLIDRSGELAASVDATRTPEAVVIDASGNVRYRGRIDDQYGIQDGQFFSRPKASRADLAEAVEDVLEGRDVLVDRTTAPGCLIGRPTRTEEPAVVTWSEQIAPIMQAKCEECHHAGTVAPFSLTDYDEARGWATTMAEAVDDNRMPPWNANPAFGHFSNERRLSEDEKRLIRQWATQGAAPGDLSLAPPAGVWPGGWTFGEPDKIVPVTAKPFPVPATGPMEYLWFEVDPGFTEDVWINGFELRPGVPKVVHHIVTYYRRPYERFKLAFGKDINFLHGFNPGGGTWRTPPGTAFKLPAGTQLVFEVHYEPDGVPHDDESLLGLYFAKPSEVKHELAAVMLANTDFVLQPGASDTMLEAEYNLPVDAEIVTLRPHMHLRGKSFRFDAILPSGEVETLLDVPRYDFHWQLYYNLAKPRFLPKGTTIRCRAHYDNSAANPNNPDSTATVRWGDQTWDEMMIGGVILIPLDPGTWWWLRVQRDVAIVACGGAIVVGFSLLTWLWMRRRRRVTADRSSL